MRGVLTSDFGASSGRAIVASYENGNLIGATATGNALKQLIALGDVADVWEERL